MNQGGTFNGVQASEKVYQDFRLEVKNAGGHSSSPVKDNAIYHLAAGLARLQAYEFPVALNEVTRTYFERSAAVESDPRIAADMRALARPQTDLAAAARLSAMLPYYNAQMRTTCVATLLEGGHATNALSQLAGANVNCRILTSTLPSTVKDTLIKVLVDPVMSTGATDGLFLRNGEIPTYGIDGTFGDMEDVRAHGRDERVGVKQFYEGLEFQYRLIKALAR